MVNFKKVTAIASSLLLTGMSVVAAASYPKPFVDGSTANVAIVYGTGAGVSALDKVQAGNIQTDLESSMTTTGTGSAVSGESYKFEKETTKFHLGDTISGFKSTLRDDELPVLLAEGKYVDDDNDEFDYTQKITTSTSTRLTMFDNNDYADDNPTVGFEVANGAFVMNYTLDFTDQPLMSDLLSTDLPMMGRQYYVLENTTTAYGNKLTLLDSAEDAIISEGESIQLTVEGTTYDVAIEFVSSSEVRLDVNGEITGSLDERETYKLNDGAYLGIKDILYTSKDTGISKVEFSIGNGKLVLENSREIELNEETVDELYAYIVNTTSGDNKLDEITLKWLADDTSFITEDTELVMPGFETVKLSYGGLIYPAEEVIEVVAGGDDYLILNDFPLKETTEDVYLLYGSTATANFTGIGKDSDDQLRTSATSSLTFNKSSDEYFVATYINGDEGESYLVRATDFDDSNNNRTTFQYLKDGSWVDAQSKVVETDSVTLGSVELTVGNINVTDETVTVAAGSNVNFNTLVSAEGLKVYLPYDSVTAGTGAINATYGASSFVLAFVEEDENDNIGSGAGFNLTLGWSTSPYKTQVTALNNESASLSEIGESDIDRSFMYSALATEFLYDRNDEDSVKIMYHGSEVSADVYIASSEATVTTTGGSLGEVLVMDSEVSSVDSKNLIIVGGSCINSAAATVLGGAYCGSAFTDATNVGPGQYLIKGVDGAYTAGKLALVVAGYNAEDTVAATTYLTTQTVDTSKTYIGTSSTSAEVVTESQ